MSTNPASNPDQDSQSRRSFLKLGAAATGLAFLKAGTAQAASVPTPKEAAAPVPAPAATPEWRNRQPGMHYRQLGRTGLMISEICMGATFTEANYAWVKKAIDAGINYFDTAQRYAGGRSEKGVGQLAKDVGRDRLYIATKLSSFTLYLDELAKDIMKGLPSEKQQALLKQRDALLEERGVMRPGYYYKYFWHQKEELEDGYLVQVILKEYGCLAEWSPLIKKRLLKSMDESLVRLQTDHVDVLHALHGARSPEEQAIPVLRETLDMIRQQGKTRFFGLSIHSDVTSNLESASNLGFFDMAMVAYNPINQAGMDMPLRKAALNGMGLVAMKTVNPFVEIQDKSVGVPAWRIEKLNAAMPGTESIPVRAYMWALQNPHISSAVSAIKNATMLAENIGAVGQKRSVPAH